jgi:hypothetical protein
MKKTEDLNETGKKHKEKLHMLISEEHRCKAVSPKSANVRVFLATRQ